jgi:hypothetical protein
MGVSMGRTIAILTAVVLFAGLATPALAQDGAAHAIDDFVSRTSDYLDDNLIFGKIRFRPSLTEKLIYDDNIWMNDHNEPETRGREDDWIISSRIGLMFLLPVNENYTKFFRRAEVTILDLSVDFQNYLDNTEVSSINYDVSTSIFGFLSDLTKTSGGKPYGFFYEVAADYSHVSNPLDLLERPLGPALLGIPIIPEVSRQDSELRWKEAHADVVAGWRGNMFDARVGYEYDWVRFDDEFYEQADHDMHTVKGEVGMNPSFQPQGRLFLKGKYSDLSYDKGVLNDAKIWEGRVGFEGPLFSKRLRFYVDGGIKYWDSQDTGGFTFTNAQDESEFRENPDTDDFTDPVWLGRVAFTPWEHRKTMFQLETGRDVGWSAISNYRVDTYVMFTVFDEIIPKKLDVDMAVSYSWHDPSDGPYRKLFEIGAGLTYHLVPQVDLYARYLFRNQRSSDEIAVTFVEPNSGGGLDSVTLRSDGDFYQNIFSLGFMIWF